MRRIARHCVASAVRLEFAFVSVACRWNATTRTTPNNIDATEAAAIASTSTPPIVENHQEGPQINSVATPTIDAKPSDVSTPEPEPDRWLQKPFQDPDLMPIIDEKGEYIVSTKQWPTGDVAYRTPEPPGHLAPRFGYNVLQVRKDVSWWQHYHKYPRFSIAYLNIQLIFLLGIAWLSAWVSTEYRNITDEMRTPGAMVGEHRGRGPSNKATQKISFTHDEMDALIGGAQNDWLDSKGERNYVGSKEYRMKQITRPKEFSTEDFRKR